MELDFARSSTLVALVPLGLLLLTWLTWCYFRLRRTSGPGVVLTVLAIRCLTVVLMCFCLLEPTVTYEEEHTREPEIMILIDTSKSMSLEAPAEVLAGKNAVTRARAAYELLAESKPAKRLRRLFGVSCFRFDQKVHALPEKLRPDDLKPRGALTNITSALREGWESSLGRDLSAIVLISDGQHNQMTNPIEAADSLDVPLYCIGAGLTEVTETEDATTLDLAVRSVRAPESVAKGYRVTVEADIVAEGAAQSATEVTLRLGGKVVDRRLLPIQTDKHEETIHLQFTPPGEGDFPGCVEITPVPGERTALNNRKEFALHVEKDKLRVLIVSGAPNYEYKYFHRVVENDPHLSFLSLVRIAPRKFIAQPAKEANALGVKFPLRPEDAKKFAIFVFMNIERDAFGEPFLTAVAKEVNENGKSILMTGGSQSLADGKYAGSAIEPLLPVSLELPEKPAGMTSRPYRVLFGAASAHPILQMSAHGLSATDVSYKLPKLTEFSRLGEVRPAGLVLAYRELPGDASVNLPLLVVGRSGKGKSAVLAVAGTWKWHTGSPEVGRRFHEQLWLQMIRWLVPAESEEQDEESQIIFWTSKNTYALDELIQVYASILHQEERGVTLSAKFVHPGGETATLMFAPDPQHRQRYSVEAQARAPGEVAIECTARSKGRTLAESKMSVQVTHEEREMQAVTQNRDLLQNLALRTGGEYADIREAELLLNGIKPPKDTKFVTVTRRRLSNSWVLLVLIVGCFTVEWLVRRRAHLV